MEVNKQNVFAFIFTVLCCLIQISIVNGQVEGLAGLANSLGNLLSGFDDDCTYTCPNGKKPKRRKNHKPSFNGCGAYGIEIGMENMPGGMTRCCNTHDLCYDTCNNKRHNCDKEFKECLSDVCHRLKTKKGTKECLSTVDLMQAGTSVFGCQAYLDSQKKACRCGKRGNKKNAHVRDNTESEGDGPSIVLPDLSHIFDDEL